MLIQHNKPTLGLSEALAAAKTIRSGWVAQGKQVTLFENELCSFLGLPEGHAVCVSSGTAALALALWVCDAKNKNVCMPVYACSSLRHAVAFAGGKEQVIDISETSPNIDVAVVNKFAPDIVIMPHMFGIPGEILKVKSGIKVVEDCAQAIGAEINGKQAGTLGDIAIFSFFATKLITAGGQGGAVVSKNKALIDAVRDYREFDCRDDKRKRFNFQLSDTLASVGRVQLRKLPVFLHRREKLYKEYVNHGLSLLNDSDDGINVPVRFRAVLKTKSPSRIVKRLSQSGVKTIVPIEDWELLGRADDFPKAKMLCRESVSLPIYPSLSKKAVHFISERCQIK